MSNEILGNLAILRQTYLALAKADTLKDVKEIRDKAEAARTYARSAAMGLEIQNAAAVLKLRAERKAGELLAKLSLRGGDRKSKSHDATLKLADLGIDRSQSARWQREALVPETVFQQYIAAANDKATDITAQGLLRLAKKTLATHPLNMEKHRCSQNAEEASSDFRPDGTSAVSGSCCGDDQATDSIIAELGNHLNLLERILAPLCGKRQIALKTIDKRMIVRLLREQQQLVAQLAGRSYL